MGTEINIFNTLEDIWKKDENGVEFIYARDLAKVLGYEGKNYWSSFKNPLEKAKISCETSGNLVSSHFLPAQEKANLGLGKKREIDNYKLTRYACYLVVQNSDPRKEEVAFAQHYFASQTRKLEIILQRKDDYERLSEREELKEAERIFSEEIYQRGVDDKGFSRIRSKGDNALFGKTTKEMKETLNVQENRPLADFLDPISVTAKKLATQISNHNVKTKNMQGEEQITQQHIKSNVTIREALIKENIYPEKLPPAEDINKVKSRLNKDIKSLTKNNKKSDKGR